MDQTQENFHFPEPPPPPPSDGLQRRLAWLTYLTFIGSMCGLFWGMIAFAQISAMRVTDGLNMMLIRVFYISMFLMAIPKFVAAILLMRRRRLGLRIYLIVECLGFALVPLLVLLGLIAEDHPFLILIPSSLAHDLPPLTGPVALAVLFPFLSTVFISGYWSSRKLLH